MGLRRARALGVLSVLVASACTTTAGRGRGDAPAAQNSPNPGVPVSQLPPVGRPVSAGFFNRDPQRVAVDLLGKVLCHRVGGLWLMARLIETEAYYTAERASHASLGFTPKRRALFMAPGTVYMYYARGGDSFNVSCRGAGNAVLFKAAVPLLGAAGGPAMLRRMAALNPLPSGRAREPARLCSGQTLLCRSLGLRVPEWDARPLPAPGLWLVDVGHRPEAIVRLARLGIPAGRDGHLPYRFVDFREARLATRPPARRGAGAGAVHPFPRGAAGWRALASREH